MFQLALSVRALGQVGASLSLSTARPILLSGNAVSPGVVTGTCGPMGVSGTARNEPLAARAASICRMAARIAGRAPGSLISRRDTLTCWSPWTWAYRRSAVCVLHRDIENFAEETFGLLDNI